MPSNTSETPTAMREKTNLKATAFAAAKFLLLGVRESADAFPPLRAVANVLCFVLENCEVRPSPHIRFQMVLTIEPEN